MLRTCLARARRGACGGGSARPRAHGPPKHVSMTALYAFSCRAGKSGLSARAPRAVAGRSRARDGFLLSAPHRAGARVLAC
eukprot:1419126-Pleurochrysis_carterae.AAC.1